MRGRKHEPVKICRLFCRVYTKAGDFIKQTKDYFEVRSKSMGNCGHKHRTEAAAMPCRERLQRLWTKRRSEQSKAAAKARREALAS